MRAYLRAHPRAHPCARAHVARAPHVAHNRIAPRIAARTACRTGARTPALARASTLTSFLRKKEVVVIPSRIQLSRRKGWRMPPNTVKVDRSTPWGNPFVVGKDGTRARCVDLYLGLMAGYLCLNGNAAEQERAHNYIAENFKSLRGKNLACWCPLNAPCHADVLLEIANA